MTGLVTFGDLLEVAHQNLGRAGAVPGRPPDVGRDLLEVRGGMHVLVTEICRCLPGDGRANACVVLEVGGSPAPWPAACAQARRAAGNAARVLAPPLVTARRPPGPVTERGSLLHAAARALVGGRDLLASHLGLDAGGRERAGCSAWAAVVCSPTISRAVAGEMAALARQAAALGAGLAMATPADWAETTQARRDLAGACAHLRTMAGAIMAAHRREPVLAADRAVLRAIPVAITPPRRLPGSREPVAALCQGVIAAAERLRHSAALAAARSGRSADLSASSLRHAAAAAVATSHHCSVLLGTLEQRTGSADGAAGDAWAGFGLAVALAEAGRAAGQARDGWLRAARTLDQVTSDIRGHMGSEAADARDLALWTGRLTYADPRWTPASGPRATPRRAADLAPERQDMAVVVGAVHHASDALGRLAEAHEQQARSAAQARRFLAPARSQPQRDAASRPYGPAPLERVAVVLSAYRQARAANAEAEERVAVVADAVRAPSVAVARARELASDAVADRRHIGEHRRAGLLADSAVYEVDHVPGPVERSLQMLGSADPEQIRRAVAIDRAGEQLIVEACAEQGSRPDPLTELTTAVEEMARHRRASAQRPKARGRGITAARDDQLERQP